MPCWHNTKNVRVLIVINGSHHVRSVSVTIKFRNEVISPLQYMCCIKTYQGCMKQVMRFMVLISVLQWKHDTIYKHSR